MKITKEELEKRCYKVCIVLAFLAALLAVIIYKPAPVGSQRENHGEQVAELPADLVFWYDEAQYKDFFEKCAVDYYEETGIGVQPVLIDSVQYINEIYDATMQAGTFPDVYLSSTDQLERLKLAGLAAADDCAQDFVAAGVDERAIEQAQIADDFYGYVFAFETPVLVNHTGYYTEEMQSFEQMMNFATEHELENEDEVLLKWELADVMYNFSFLGAYIDMQIQEDGTFSYENKEEVNAAYEFLASLSKVTYVDEKESKDDIISAFQNHLTVSAIINSSSLSRIDLEDVEVTTLPRQNEALETKTLSIIDALVVNAYSENESKAQDFAIFVALEEAENLEAYAGKYPINASLLQSDIAKTVFAQYENSVIKPDSMEAENFFLNLQAEFLKQWNMNAE